MESLTVVKNLATTKLTKKDDFKNKLKAMRLRIKKKRERFLSALASVEKVAATITTTTAKTELFDDIEDDDGQDTIRSMEVSFGKYVTAANTPVIAASRMFTMDEPRLHSKQSSSISRTSTPIYAKSSHSVLYSFPALIANETKKRTTAPKKSSKKKCCHQRIQQQQPQPQPAQRKQSMIVVDHKCNFDYFSYSKTMCQFQDLGEFKVWFV